MFRKTRLFWVFLHHWLFFAGKLAYQAEVFALPDWEWSAPFSLAFFTGCGLAHTSFAFDELGMRGGTSVLIISQISRIVGAVGLIWTSYRYSPYVDWICGMGFDLAWTVVISLLRVMSKSSCCNGGAPRAPDEKTIDEQINESVRGFTARTNVTEDEQEAHVEQGSSLLQEV